MNWGVCLATIRTQAKIVKFVISFWQSAQNFSLADAHSHKIYKFRPRIISCSTANRPGGASSWRFAMTVPSGEAALSSGWKMGDLGGMVWGLGPQWSVWSGQGKCTGGGVFVFLRRRSSKRHHRTEPTTQRGSITASVTVPLLRVYVQPEGCPRRAYYWRAVY